MGIAKLNIWISDVVDPCRTWKGEGKINIFNCKDILEWPCGRYRDPDGRWHPVPNNTYRNLPFKCGHLEVELPPGCYWTFAYVSPSPERPYPSFTHIGIVYVNSGESASVKLYNSSFRLCWDSFLIGLKMHALTGEKPDIPTDKIEHIEKNANELLQQIPSHPMESVIERIYDDFLTSAKKAEEKQDKNEK
jgi:hypothetical protein